jgi:ATP-binding cassette subfamily F protein 3
MLREPTAQHPEDNRLFKPQDAQTIKLRINTDLRSGDRVIETHDLAVGYQDDKKILFRAPDVLLWREECAALIGPNGAGKTTFLKTLLGDIPPLAGSVKLGSSLKVGYFAQAHEGLNPDRTVLEEILAVREMPIGKVRDYAAKFLFTGDDVFKPVSVLSGGERGRVALAKLALEGANLLLLDEPTNHLDIPSQEILEAVLADFPGTILLVSHDRYLIDALATQIWSVEDGQLEVFKGDWSEYVVWKEGGKKAEEQDSNFKIQDSKAKSQNPKSKPTGRGAVPASNAPKPKSKIKNQQSEERKRAARLSEVEKKIAALEARLTELAQDLEQASAAADAARARELGEEYAYVERDLSDLMGEWETLAA